MKTDTFAVPNMGNHLVMDFTNVTSIDLNNYEELDVFLTKTIAECGATIEAKTHKIFTPQGLTILYLLSESHFSIHTWPENGSCAIDFYHCGDKAKGNLERAEILLADKLGWENLASSVNLTRGNQRQFMLNNWDHSSTLFRGVKLIHREKTEFQELRVFDTKEMGRCLVLDGMIQITDSVEDNYTIDLTTLCIKKEKTYEHLLLIGAGDMLIPTYILENFTGVKKMTVVEIDRRVVENTRKYFTFSEKIEGFIKEGRLEIIFDDGAKFLKEKIRENQSYDSLIIDNTDVHIFDGPAASLFTPEFYASILKVLKPGGSFSQQVSDENIKRKWEDMVRSVGFNEFNYLYSKTPEYSTVTPMGKATKGYS